MGMYYGNICMENQCISHSLFSKHVSSGYLNCKLDQLILKCCTERYVLVLFAIYLFLTRTGFLFMDKEVQIICCR